MNQQFEKVLFASRKLNLLDTFSINKILQAVATATEENIDYILAENAKDLAKMEQSNPMYDRLQLTTERIKGIATDIRNVAGLSSPLDKKIDQRELPNGMTITKRSVAFGVIGIIYEARPNVTLDVFSLCLKSGNACVLKGGSDAHNSNTAIVKVIKDVLRKYEVDENTITLLPAEREHTNDLLNAVGYVDLIIPRGGKSLIEFVRKNSQIPVIETGAGICHTYYDEFADLTKGCAIINNAKTRRVSVCNALDCLVIHQSRLADLKEITKPLAEHQVEIFADEAAYDALAGNYPAELLSKVTLESYGTEFLSYKMAIKTVTNITEAIEHIAKYSSKHSECIVSENAQNIALFDKMVDAACVYTNVSTAFTDGAQFGLGAEIGISTQKMHARGPMALEELCTYKWFIKGDGQVRS